MSEERERERGKTGKERKGKRERGGKRQRETGK